jgi:FkbM family methyltransferase
MLRALLARRGIRIDDADPLTRAEVRRAKLLRSRGVDLVLDVGAAGGRYGGELRSGGYVGRIFSFEPLSDAFSDLVRAVADDAEWGCMQAALGAFSGEMEINVSENSDSSSFLPMGERHRRTAPESAYVATEQVQVRALDSIWDEVAAEAQHPFLKLDVQGYELKVLAGARGSLPKLAGVQVELSLVPLYKGAPTVHEVIDLLESEGFRLAGLEPGFCDRESGELLQADGLFVR